MDLDAAIAGRRAIRDYTGQPVDEPTIHRLVEAAVWAPSAINRQPWAFTVVRDQAVLDRVSHGAKAHMLETLPPGFGDGSHRGMLGDPGFHIFYHAPVLILVGAEAAGPFIVEDCALAAENLMLAAYGLGLGSCWIGFAQAYLNTPDGKAALGLPEAWLAVAPIIVGHPKAAAPPVPRRPPQIRWVG